MSEYIISRLKKVPHLKLPYTVSEADMVKMQEELARSPELVGYELPSDDEAKIERYRKNWRGRGLIDFEADSSKGMCDARPYKGNPPPIRKQYRMDGKTPRYFHTELAKECPTMMKVIMDLFSSPGRCRITAMAAGGSLDWHSHCQFISGNYEGHKDYDLAIVHVPLKTNPDVKFGVTKFHHSDFGVNPYWQHYAVGEAWLLNAWHEHNVVNEGDTDRVHLMLYGSLHDLKMMPWLTGPLMQYEGPWIE